MLVQTIRKKTNITSKTNLMNNVAKLVIDIYDECLLTPTDHLTHTTNKHTENYVIETY